jgi:hypothetical protein
MVSRFSNHHFRMFLRYLTWMSLLGVVCLGVSYVRFHTGSSFFKALLSESFGVFAEWPAAWASLVVLLLSGCVLCLVLALDELLPALKRECFSAGTFYGLMVLPLVIFGLGSFLLARALL